jgi:predicted ATPase
VSEGALERNAEGLRVPRYRFVHELLGEVLERRVRGSRRAQIHRDIADLLDANRSPRNECLVELVRHLEGAGLLRRAARVRGELARVSVARSGYSEAARHLELALALLETTPADPERDQAELELRMLYFLPLHATRGYGAPEAARNAIRASELASATGEVLEVAVLGAPWTFHLVRAEFDAAERLALRSLATAERLADPALELAAHLRVGTTLFYRGRLSDARRHLERAELLYDVERDGASLPWNDLDPGVTSSAYLAWTLFMLGEEERALERVDAAIALARRLERPHSEALALDFAAALHAWRGDVTGTRASADAAITLCERLGFPQWLALGYALRGWARSHAGEPDAGLAEMSGAIHAYRAAGANLSVPYFLALLADSLSVAGRHEQACAAIAEALELAERSGERYHAAELRRLRGEILLAARAPRAIESARSAFGEALAIARSQLASALERRALASLARLDERPSRPGLG